MISRVNVPYLLVRVAKGKLEMYKEITIKKRKTLLCCSMIVGESIKVVDQFDSRNSKIFQVLVK